jgi:hypothetical protein
MYWGLRYQAPAIPETQRSTGGDYVADCTSPDDVEPARRRLIQPVGWLAPSFNSLVEAASTFVRLQALRACAQKGAL